MSQIFCHICQVPGHATEQCTTCTLCKAKGHIFLQCPEKDRTIVYPSTSILEDLENVNVKKDKAEINIENEKKEPQTNNEMLKQDEADEIQILQEFNKEKCKQEHVEEIELLYIKNSLADKPIEICLTESEDEEEQSKTKSPPAFVPYSQPPPDMTTSLQKSPDYLENDDINDEQCPRMERNHSQIIIHDPPPDHEYNHAGKGNARKRGNKTKARKEEVTKKARLNVPGDKSDMSVSFYDNNTPNPSTEDMEIMNETPGKNLEERTKELMKLKRKAQSFIRASQVSAHPSQSKLDDWGARTPKNMDISNDPEIIFIDNSQDIIEPDPEIIFIENSQNDIIEPEESFLDINAGPDQPSRRQRKGSPGKITKSKSLSNHFLAKTRSGSTRSSPVRSLKSSDSSFPLFSMVNIMHPMHGCSLLITISLWKNIS